MVRSRAEAGTGCLPRLKSDFGCTFALILPAALGAAGYARAVDGLDVASDGGCVEDVAIGEGGGVDVAGAELVSP